MRKIREDSHSGRIVLHVAIITGAVHIDVGSGAPAPWTPVPKQDPAVSKRVGWDGL